MAWGLSDCDFLDGFALADNVCAGGEAFHAVGKLLVLEVVDLGRSAEVNLTIVGIGNNIFYAGEIFFLNFRKESPWISDIGFFKTAFCNIECRSLVDTKSTNPNI